MDSYYSLIYVTIFCNKMGKLTENISTSLLPFSNIVVLYARMYMIIFVKVGENEKHMNPSEHTR